MLLSMRVAPSLWSRREALLPDHSGAAAPSPPQALARSRRAPDGPRPFLLTMPVYGGTLAAARSLGRRGIPVTMAGDGVLAAARWSRYVTRWQKAPPVHEAQRFLEWLLEFGEREPGHVLYPTCDELAWLISDRVAELEKHYRLYQPSVDVMLRLLDKKALHQACREVGVDTPPTLFPGRAEEAARAGSELGFPLLVKPRTQVLSTTRIKAVLVRRPEDLAASYAGVVASSLYQPGVRAPLAGIDSPMMQAYRGDAHENIYSLAGFIDRGGRQIAARASVKILQRPRRVGVGLCFEEAPVDLPTLEGLVRLCRATGYFGVFEAEYVRDGPRLQMIDFNPRFYGQMSFENARALPLAYLVWLGAAGEDDRLARELTAAQGWREGAGYIYTNRFFLRMMLSLQRLTGNVPRAEAGRWRRWLSDHRRRALAVDAAHAADDRLPGLVSAAYEMYAACRHPRYFMRQILLNRD